MEGHTQRYLILWFIPQMAAIARWHCTADWVVFIIHIKSLAHWKPSSWLVVVLTMEFALLSLAHRLALIGPFPSPISILLCLIFYSSDLSSSCLQLPSSYLKSSHFLSSSYLQGLLSGFRPARLLQNSFFRETSLAPKAHPSVVISFFIVTSFSAGVFLALFNNLQCLIKLPTSLSITHPWITLAYVLNTWEEWRVMFLISSPAQS